jgi:CHAT domain-containing protein
VVASLWPVNDVSTAFLMDRFYELWLGDQELTVAQALQSAARWLRNASKADLLARIAASSLAEEARALVQELLRTVMVGEGARMANAATIVAAEEIDSRPEDQPYAAPHYWAAFAAYGAVV